MNTYAPGPGRPSGRLGASAPAYPLLKMNHRHDALVEWLIANPHRNKREAARDLDYSPQMIYMIVGSDLFQAHYKERCEERGEVATHLFDARIRGIAELALEKTEDKLNSQRFDTTTGKMVDHVDARFLQDTTKTALQALGYLSSNREPDVSQHLHIHVGSEELEEARERSRASGPEASLPSSGSGGVVDAEASLGAGELKGEIDVL